MLDERYPNAVRVRLVLDNLNTHGLTSLYDTFEPQEARRLGERIEFHYTPKHGRWLNLAEIELVKDFHLQVGAPCRAHKTPGVRRLT